MLFARFASAFASRGLTKLALVLALLLATGTTAVHAAGFSIAGGRLYDARGAEFIIRGISHSDVWFQSQTATALPNIAATGANAVRIVLGNGVRWGPTSQARVAELIALCKANALIPILEVHDTTGFGEQAGASTLAQAASFWVGVKDALIGQEDYVIVNIGNEPLGNNQPASAWIDGHTSAIATLRAAGLTHTIMVDAANWGQDWQGIMRTNAATVFNADPLKNVIFSVHMYEVYGQAATITNYLNAFATAGLPLVVGEFAADHNPGQNVDEATIMATCESLGMGYIGWSWSGNGGGLGALDITVNFNPANLTAWGTTLIQGANGIAATSDTCTVYGAPTPPAAALSVPPQTFGDATTLSATSSGGPGTTFQWQILIPAPTASSTREPAAVGEWTDIPGATGATYTILSTQRFHAVSYRVIATTNRVPAISVPVALSANPPAANDARLLNLSTRGLATSGAGALFPGFVVEGSGTKRLLIRAVGPSLAALGFNSPVMPDPRMVLKRFNFTTNVYEDREANDDWGTNANAADIVATAGQLSAFALTDAKDAALLVELPAGQYAVVGDDKNGTSGIGIVELYDADVGSPAARLINISNRGFAGVGDEVMIPGFVVSAEGPKSVLVRVVGPTLGGFGVAGTMTDPKLTIYSGATAILANDNWSENPDAAYTASIAQQVLAFPLAVGSADAAFVVTLAPGSYTVVGSSATPGGAGIVLVELYVLP